MQPAILLRGTITEDSLGHVWREIEYHKGRDESDIVLIIDSHGGNGTKAIEFIEKVKDFGVTISAKIYHAESAAALIALSANKRDIVVDGWLVIHLGSVTVESCDIGYDCVIPRHFKVMTDEIRKMALGLLDEIGALKPSSYVDKLLATNRLTLTAEQCLELGIVDRIVG